MLLLFLSFETIILSCYSTKLLQDGLYFYTATGSKETAVCFRTGSTSPYRCSTRRAPGKHTTKRAQDEKRFDSRTLFFLTGSTLRVLAVGNTYAAYQIIGAYPFEVFTHSLGHNLIATHRLPETVFLYATKGRCKEFKNLLQALDKVMPLSSLTIHRQCVIGTVTLEEISAAKAATIAPGIPILDNASQILHITKRVMWSNPFQLLSLKRFDRWVPLTLDVQTRLSLHAEEMSAPPAEISISTLDLVPSTRAKLVTHPRSTPGLTFLGCVCAELEVYYSYATTILPLLLFYY